MIERKEGDIRKAIIDALNATGEVVCWITPSGKARGGKQRLAPTGTPDILGYTTLRHRAPGRLVGIEVKKPVEEPTFEQRNRLRHMVECDCLAGVAESITGAFEIASIRARLA